MHIKHRVLYVFCTKYWSSMVYRGWTIGCAVQCTVYSVFYSVCWDTTVVLAQWFVVAYTLYIVRCTSSYGRVWCMWCMVFGACYSTWCGGVQYGSYGVVCVYGSVVLCTVLALL